MQRQCSCVWTDYVMTGMALSLSPQLHMDFQSYPWASWMPGIMTRAFSRAVLRSIQSGGFVLNERSKHRARQRSGRELERECLVDVGQLSLSSVVLRCLMFNENSRI